MTIFKIIILSLIQGAAELLPISSSAHVIVAEKLMGLDPSAPEMTFLLVMLHTGTMVAVLAYFWPRWRKLPPQFIKMVFIATAVTGVLGLALKKIIEDVILKKLLGESQGEIEHLFKSLPLIALALFSVGIVILVASQAERRATQKKLTTQSSVIIGMVQGLCLPFRGFSRSGATISAAILSGISKPLAEDFSFALAVVLTPPVVARELYRLLKFAPTASHVYPMIAQSLLGMLFSFIAGMFALRWLSSWLEKGKWKYFGIYCILASVFVLILGINWV